jgi:branched-chain amino acid aminotransferase
VKVNCKFIWMDGELLEAEKAVIPFLSSALHYGMAAFEGIRCYDTDHGPAVFRLKDHVKRLLDSVKILGFRQFPYTLNDLCGAVKKTIIANGFNECYIRPLVMHDGPNASLDLGDGVARVGIAVWGWASFFGGASAEKGVRMNVSSYTRHHPNISMTKAKITGNYANSTLAKTESIRLGFDEAVMLDPQGYVAECTGENLFLVHNGKIFTPPLGAVLEGLTRDTIITLARDFGYSVIEEPISRDQLYTAEELFVCGTAAECIAVSEVDFRTIGDCRMGPITRQVQQAYHDAVHGKHPRSAAWLDYVNE